MTTYYDAGLGPATLRLAINQASQSVSANTSTDTWGLYLICGNGASWNADPVAYSVSINGNVYSGSFTFDFRSYTQKTIVTGSTVVPHATNGTKSTAISGAIANTGTVIPGGSTGGTFTQTTIPRASTPTFSPSPMVAGDPVVISTHRASTSFTHNLTYSFGSASGTIATGVATDYTWTPPLSLLNEIPNSASGTGTITCVTKSGSTTIGTKNVSFTLQPDTDIVPTFTSITCTEAVSGVATSVGAFVQKNSKLNVGITGAAGVYGSTITAYKIVVDSQTINAVSGTTNFINSSGTIPVTATVTDSRGRTYTDNISIVVLPWAPPTITTATLQRTNSGGTPQDDGTYVTVTLNAAVQSLKPAATEKNALSYRVSSRDHNVGGSYTVKATVTPGGITFNSTKTVGTYDIEDSFDFLVEVIDLFATTAAGSIVPTAVIFMHWDGKDGVGVLKYREHGALDVNGDVYLSGALSMGKAQLVTDWNNAKTPGFYYGASATNGPTAIDGGSGSWFTGWVTWHDGSTSGAPRAIQTLREARGAGFMVEYTRYWDSTSWSSWLARAMSPLPAFQAYLTTNFSKSGSPATTSIIPLATELYDNTNSYSTSTYLFTAPVAGLYEFTLSALQTGTVGGPALKIGVNGTPDTATPFDTLLYGIAYNGSTTNKILALSKGDLVGAYAINNNGTSITLAGGYGTMFSGKLLQ